MVITAISITVTIITTIVVVVRVSAVGTISIIWITSTLLFILLHGLLFGVLILNRFLYHDFLLSILIHGYIHGLFLLWILLHVSQCFNQMRGNTLA
jgi:hypothetical protein